MNKFLISVSLFTFVFIASIAAAVDTGGMYYSIHNGSYRTENSARRYCEELEKIGVSTFIDKVEIKGKGTWYRVYAGRYPDIKTAKTAVGELKKKKINGLGMIKKFQVPAGQKGSNTPLARPSVVKESPSGKKSAVNETKAVKEAKNGASGKEHAFAKPLSNPALGEAETAFREGHFAEAVTMLDHFLSAGNNDKQLIEAARRLRAESIYRIGINGNSQDMLKAVENYKALLKNYPDPAAENDLVYSNLAKGYQKLNFFYEAAAAWEGIVLSYQDSPFFEEALFRSGYALLPTGKKEKIYERMDHYLKRYPNGTFAKQAYYTIGHSLFRMGSLDQAVKWFDTARKRWPDISDQDKAVIESMGRSYFDAARYRDALSIFSFMTSVYPDFDVPGEWLFLAARSADMGGYAELALKLYGSYVGAYPQGRHLDECELFMADLGVEKPGLDSSAAIWHSASYSNPLQTYDRLLAKGSSVGEERVMLGRGKALEKKGDLQGALDNYITMLSRYPRGKLKDIVFGDMKNLIALIVDGYYAKEDYVSLAKMYFELKGKVPLCSDKANCIKFGRAFQKTGLYKEARDLYAETDHSGKSGNDELLFALIELDIDMKDPVAAEYKLGHLPQKKGREYGEKINELMRKLADLYMSSGNFEKAAILYRKLTGTKGPQDPIVYIHYGRCLEAMKNPSQARKSYETALEFCENNRKMCKDDSLSDIYIGLGDTWSVQGDVNKGIGMYRKALEYTSDNESKRWLMLKTGQAYSHLNEQGAAEKSFSRIKEVPDGDFWPAVADFFITQLSSAKDNRGRQ